MNFEFMAHDTLTTGRIKTNDLPPVELGNKIGNGLALDVRLEPKETGDGLVEIEDMPMFIDHQHAILNRVEQRFQESPLAGQTLDDILKTLRIESAHAAQNLVKKAGHGHQREPRRPKSECRK